MSAMEYRKLPHGNEKISIIGLGMPWQKAITRSCPFTQMPASSAAIVNHDVHSM